MKSRILLVVLCPGLLFATLANADCWRDQRTGQIACTNANSTPPTVQHQSGTWVVQQNPYTGRTVVNAGQLAYDGVRVVRGAGAVAAGSAAEATMLGVPLGIPADAYGAYQIGNGIRSAPGHYNQMQQNYQAASTWQPTQQPYYVPPPTRYQRMCRAQNGAVFPC